MLALGGLLLAARGLGAPARHHGAVMGAAAGILFGVSDVALKALTDAGGGGALAVLPSPWLLVAVAAAVLAFLASARGFQQGDAVSVIACTSTGANVTAIVAGITVFGDALSGGDAHGRPDRRLRPGRRRRDPHPGGTRRTPSRPARA